MALLKEHKQEILKHFRKSDLDTGSSEVQVALLSFRIKDLTEHFKVHKKDTHSQIGLVKMVNKRRRLLDYLKSKSPERYAKVISELDLRY